VVQLSHLAEETQSSVTVNRQESQSSLAEDTPAEQTPDPESGRRIQTQISSFTYAFGTNIEELALISRLKSGLSWNYLSRSSKHTMQAVCQSYGLPYKDLSKDIMLQSLINEFEGKQTSEGTSGGAHLSKSRRKSQERILGGNNDHDEILGLLIMTETWTDMTATSVPSWVSKAPSNWGTTKRGKLSSGEWNVITLIHLPFTLIRLWGLLDPEDRRRQLLDNFMHLVEAIISATLKVVRPSDIENYRVNISAYMSGYKDLFKGALVYPVQHTALHLDEKLLDYGPSSGQNGDYYE
jgi:hypothetical protein